jgi:Peptidase C13 family
MIKKNCHSRESGNPVARVGERNDSLPAPTRANWVPARFAAGMTLLIGLSRLHEPASHARKLIATFGGLLLLFLPACAHAASPFSNWAAVVVAGDWHTHDGSPSEIFDNARRDVTRDLVALGFSQSNIDEFSARPGAEEPSTARAIAAALSDLSNHARAGCLLYFSSHGSPDGMVLGNAILEPYRLARILNASCGDRPTVVVLSACFSGVFVPTLAAPNRMILTAARRDRTSFGCGQADRYPYFDQCVLSVWSYADSFPALGRAAQVCVAAREKKEHVGPPSQPQLWVGADAASEIPKWR